MKKMKVYIVTYKRCDILNDTLKKLFDSDFSNLPNTEVNIINNHSEFHLEPQFKNKVNVLHNTLRPDWSNGNLAENWNQALINGFRDLSNPDAEYVVTMQNDTSVHPKWCTNLLKMHERFNFIVGKYGDNLVSYTPDAVKKIGLWDENFFGVQYKEADYWIRALIFNKDKTCINDTLHGLEVNNSDALELDTTVDRNFVEESGFAGDNTLKRRADDAEHQQIWSTRGGVYKQYAWKYFYEKWSGTWKEDPRRETWVKNWSKDFIDNPPDITKSKVKNMIRYIYFEKDIEDLKGKNYLV
tara:strand:- start:843 stop:1736 length:894 start_codon:yes stop_codon:yes gene_type:complete